MLNKTAIKFHTKEHVLNPLPLLLQHPGLSCRSRLLYAFFFIRRKSDFVSGEKKTEHSRLDTCIGWIFHAKERFREAFYGGVATILQASAETRRLTWRRQDNVGTLSHSPAYRVE